MQPDRELDKRIAELMGWTEISFSQGNPIASAVLTGIRPDELASPYTGYKPRYNIPEYSKDIKAAWEVVEKLKWAEPELSWNDEQHCWCLYLNKIPTPPQGWPTSDTASRAICLAAKEVLALGVVINQ